MACRDWETGRGGACWYSEAAAVSLPDELLESTVGACMEAGLRVSKAMGWLEARDCSM